MSKRENKLPDFTHSVTLLISFFSAEPVEKLGFPTQIFNSIKNETLEYSEINSRDYTMPYAEISTTLYEKDFADEDIDILVDDGQRYINDLDSVIEDELTRKSISRNIQKFCEHVQLASIQKNVLLKQQVVEIKMLEKEARLLDQKLEKSLEETNNLNQKIKELIKEIENIKGKLYTEIVAILGIFSALMFGLIAGFDSLTDSVVLLSDARLTMGEVGIGISLIGIVLMTFLYALIHWVSKLSGRKITDSSTRDANSLINIIYKHSLFFFCMFILIIVLLFSSIMHVLIQSGFIRDIYSNNLQMRSYIPSIFLSLAILGVVVIIIICFQKIYNRK